MEWAVVMAYLAYSVYWQRMEEAEEEGKSGFASDTEYLDLS
jgi:hypothetical protein